MKFGARTYLDYASAVPPSRRAQKAFLAALKHFGNPSAPHEEGRRARDVVEKARTTISRLAGVKAEAVIFTGSATEANALAIQGVRKGKEHVHMLYLPTAHSSVVKTMETLKEEGVAVEPLVLKNGAIDLTVLKTQLRPETGLISVDAVCGETGTRFNTRDIRRVLDSVQSKAYLHVDASQLPRVESFDRTRLGADLITLDAQKVGGVRGVGALIAPRAVALSPLIYGGGQERGLRSGTEASALIAAFAEALLETEETREEFSIESQKQKEQLVGALSVLPGLEVNAGKDSVPHILNISLRGRDTDYLVALMDEAGFAVSTKSACETDNEGSRVVHILTGDEARAASTLRISWGRETTMRELNAFARALIKNVAFLDAHTH